MAKIRKVNLKFQISISEEHLGLSRLFNELSQIEDQNQNKSQTDLHALKRRHMLKLLYDYSADKHVAGFNAPEAVVKRYYLGYHKATTIRRIEYRSTHIAFFRYRFLTML